MTKASAKKGRAFWISALAITALVLAIVTRLLHESVDGRSVTGVGIALGRAQGEVTVLDVVPRSPADRAGIRLRDIVVAVNGRDAHELSIADMGNNLRGNKGTLVGITVKPYLSSETRNIAVTRASYRIPK